MLPCATSSDQSPDGACQDQRKALHKKGTPVPATNRNWGLYGAVCAPTTRLPMPLIFDPVSVAPDTGSTAIWRQTPEAGRVPARRARSKTDATWLIPSFTLAGVMRRADARRVAVQKLYILIPLDFQGKSGIHGPLRTYPELFALMGGKVPDLRGRVTWGDATPGQTLEASLPNIRGSFVYAPSMHDWNIIGREDGAFSFEGSLPSDKWSSLDYQDQPRSPYRLSFSAERSSPIYKDGVQTVQPPAYTVRYLVRARP